jgi:hypothetical protein
MGLFMGLLMGLLGGPLFALVAKSDRLKSKFEERKEKFRNGTGKDPEKDVVGPHKSFAHNAIFFGLMYGVIGLFIGSWV